MEKPAERLAYLPSLLQWKRKVLPGLRFADTPQDDDFVE